MHFKRLTNLRFSRVYLILLVMQFMHFDVHPNEPEASPAKHFGLVLNFDESCACLMLLNSP